MAAACAFSFASGQHRPDPDEGLRRERERVEAIARASSLPEVGADFLLKLLEYGRFSDRSSRLRIAEAAFEIAESAQMDAGRKPLGNTDTVESYGAVAYAFRLSRVDLQSRAVRLIVPIEIKHAVELLERIRLTPLPSVPCSSAAALDLSHYFETLQKVLERTPEATAEDLLRLELGRVESPAQLQPLLRILRLSSGRLQERLMPQLLHAMATTRYGARSLEDSLPAIYQEASEWGRADVGRNAASGVVRAVRALTLSYLAGARCEAGRVRGQLADTDVVEDFNTRLLPLAGDAAILPLRAKDVQGKRDGGGRLSRPFWTNAASKDLLIRVSQLSYGGTVADRETVPWGRSAAELLLEVRRFEVRGDEDLETRFCEKAVLLQSLMNIRGETNRVTTKSDPATAYQSQPGFPGREQVLEDFIRLLGSQAGTRVKSRDRAVWLRAVRFLYEHHDRFLAERQAAFGAALQASGDPDLYTYGALAQIRAASRGN